MSFGKISHIVILDYFDRLATVQLPDLEDRYRALKHELSHFGIDIECSKVSISDHPMPETANEVTSLGIYGSFLSHLEIIKGACLDGLDTVWVLENSAIFQQEV